MDLHTNFRSSELHQNGKRLSNSEIVCFHMGKIDGVLFAKQRLG